MTNKVYSLDEEYFAYEHLGDLIRDADLEVGCTVFVGDAKELEVNCLIDASDILEIVADRAYDQVGEAAEDYPPAVGYPARKELEELLHGWIEKYCKPTFFTVQNVGQHTITLEDMK